MKSSCVLPPKHVTIRRRPTGYPECLAHGTTLTPFSWGCTGYELLPPFGGSHRELVTLSYLSCFKHHFCDAVLNCVEQRFSRLVGSLASVRGTKYIAHSSNLPNGVVETNHYDIMWVSRKVILPLARFYVNTLSRSNFSPLASSCEICSVHRGGSS